jgi:hypothetical protein
VPASQRKFAAGSCHSTSAPDADARHYIYKPVIKIGLQWFEACINLAAERDLIKLVEHGAVETFNDAIAGF